MKEQSLCLPRVSFEPRHEKTCFAICEQQRCRSVCASAQSYQLLRFRYLDSITRLVSISEISNLNIASVAAQAGLCLTWSQTKKTGFLVTRINFYTGFRPWVCLLSRLAFWTGCRIRLYRFLIIAVSSTSHKKVKHVIYLNCLFMVFSFIDYQPILKSYFVYAHYTLKLFSFINM